MKRAGKWAIGVVLTATAAFAALQTVTAPTSETEDTTAQPLSAASEETESPLPQTEPPVTQTCGYQWAYHSAPELTASFDAEIKALDPTASGRVEFFGEDCIYPDGTSTFLTMETDFYVRSTVDDLGDQEGFGNWISQTMKIVLGTPREKVVGKYGFVEFWFEKNDTEHLTFRVPIQQYLDEAQDLTGAELFQMFHPQP
jgi:hypothetical protein